MDINLGGLTPLYWTKKYCPLCGPTYNSCKELQPLTEVCFCHHAVFGILKVFFVSNHLVVRFISTDCFLWSTKCCCQSSWVKITSLSPALSSVNSPRPTSELLLTETYLWLLRFVFFPFFAELNNHGNIWVIPYESTEKSMTIFFFGFLTKQLKSICFFSNKNFFKTKF